MSYTFTGTTTLSYLPLIAGDLSPGQVDLSFGQKNRKNEGTELKYLIGHASR
jgi:hypothetical protein